MKNETIFDHINNLIENSPDAGATFMGMTALEISKSRKLNGWKYSFRKPYVEGRKTALNRYSGQTVECPAWYAEFHDELFYTMIFSCGRLHDEFIAMLDMIKLALVIEDPNAYYKLLD